MKRLFKIQFIRPDKKILTIHSSEVNTSSFLGLIEVKDIVFMDTSELLITPEDDKIRQEFKNVERTFLPINSIVRIDEVVYEKANSVIRLYKGKETDSE